MIDRVRRYLSYLWFYDIRIALLEASQEKRGRYTEETDIEGWLVVKVDNLFRRNR